MKRGDLVLIALQGDFGKPRPAVVIQADAFNNTHATIVVCPVTSELVDAPLFRLTVDPSPRNGLRMLSQIMADKPQAVRRSRIGENIGILESEHLARLTRSLMAFLGMA